MIGMRWILDDNGEVHLSGASELFAKLGFVHATASTEDYAIENIGFIGIDERANYAHVRYRPAVVSERAIAGLCYWLYDRPSGDVAISWFDGVWKTQPPRSIHSAICFFLHALDVKSGDDASKGPKLIAQHSDYARRRWEDKALGFWPALHVAPIPAHVVDSLDAAFLGRWMIFQQASPGQSPQIINMGRGYPPFDSIFTSDTHSEHGIDSIEDPHYRNWIRSAIIDVAETRQARFEDVDAIVHWNRFGSLRTRYWRALIPIVQQDGNVHVLSASGNNSGVDLRPKRIEKVNKIAL
jgi:hypothetical protein